MTLKSKIKLLAFLLAALLPFAAPAEEGAAYLPNLTMEALKPAFIRPAPRVTAEFKLALPPGYHLNERAPSKVTLKLGAQETSQKLSESSTSLSIDFPKLRQFNVVLEASVYFCREGQGSVCQVRSFSLSQDVSTSDKGGEKLLFPAVIDADKPGST